MSRVSRALFRLMGQFRGTRAGPLVQFIKYGIAGAIATGVHIAVFYAAAGFILPALTADDAAVRLLGFPAADITGAVRARNAAVDNVIAFVFSNITAYLINIFWVFIRGRHRWIVEFTMFVAVSAVSMVIGTSLQSMLIARFGVTTTAAFGANIVTAVLINYAMRKFVIFKG